MDDFYYMGMTIKFLGLVIVILILIAIIMAMIQGIIEYFKERKKK